MPGILAGVVLTRIDTFYFACAGYLSMCVAAIIALCRPAALAASVVATFVLSFPPVETWGILGFVAYGLLFVCLSRAGWRQAALVGFLIGASKVVCLLHWAFVSLPHPAIAMSLAACVLGLFWSGGCVLMHYLLRTAYFYAVPLVIVIGEALVASPMTNLCAYCTSAHMVASNCCLLPMVRFLGQAGCSLAVVTIGMCGALGVVRQKRPWIVAALCALGLWVLAGGVYARFGAVTPGEGVRELRIAFVQLFHPKSAPDEWADKKNLEDHIREIVLNQGPIDLLVLPEEALYETAAGNRSSSLSIDELNALLVSLGRDGMDVAAGVQISMSTDGKRFRNSVVCFRVNQAVRTRVFVDKQVPALVGETDLVKKGTYLGNLLNRILGENGSLESNRGSGLAQLRDERVGIWICNEHLIPEELRPSRYVDADFLLVVADTSWFEYSNLERLQSRAARRLLSAAHGVPLLYVDNGGSELIEPSGFVRKCSGPHSVGGIWTISIRRDGE